MADELMADEQENRGQRGLGGNFAVAAGIGAGWWAMLFAGEVARAGGRPDLLSLHSTALVYLLLLLVQGLLFLLARLRPGAPVRLLIGIYGALLLVIFAALGWGASQHGWRMKCWNPVNVSLLLYIGLSHVAYAGFYRESKG